MRLKDKKFKINLGFSLITIGVLMFSLAILDKIVATKNSKDSNLENIVENYDFNVQEITTQNNFKFLLYQKTNTPIIALSIRMEGGAGLDPRGYSGLGYVITQMMLNGTKNKTEYEILDTLDKYSIDLSFDITRDYLEINLTTLSINKDIALSLLTEILQDVKFNEESLQKIKNEQGVVFNMNMQSQEYIAYRTMVKNTFKNKQNWRPIIGSVNEVNKITLNTVESYKNRYIHKENPSITISGNIAKSEASNFVEQVVNSIGTEKKAIATKKEVNAINSQKEFNIVNNKKNQQVVVKFAFNAPLMETDKEIATFIVLNNMLGGSGLDSILMTEIRENKGLTYGIYSSLVNTKYGSLWQINASTTKEKAKELKESVKDIVDNFATKYYKDNLKQEVKYWTVGSRALSFTSNKSIINFISQDYFYKYNQTNIKDYKEHIQSVTKEDILKMAKKYLNTENMYIISVQ